MKEFWNTIANLDTSTLLGNVVAGLIVPFLIFIASLFRAWLKKVSIWRSLKTFFTYQISVYVVCLLMVFFLVIKYFISSRGQDDKITSEKPVSKEPFKYPPREQYYLNKMDSLKSEELEGRPYQEIWELLTAFDEDYATAGNLIDYRNELSSSSGSKLTWHDSGNTPIEVISQGFKSKLIHFKLMEEVAGQRYRFTKSGKKFFAIFDEINLYRTAFISIRNDRINDSIQKVGLKPMETDTNQ